MVDIDLSCNDGTKNIYSILHRQSRKHFGAVSYYVPNSTAFLFIKSKKCLL